ncbi:hypothetical protein SAMN04488543_4301 [Friedmanniella luteola]|uniref:Uncharacterized protein n=1 Tax=Friedmanniella luteola TaxID=546871 RepID=A0A1H2A8V2_9ACTN|nr:hypothetical protein SAMN04488543_4301 [Friedmanniella luteola]
MAAIGAAVGGVVWYVERRRTRPSIGTDRWAQVTDPIAPS